MPTSMAETVLYSSSKLPARCSRELINSHYPFDDRGKALEDLRIVSGNDQLRTRSDLLHSILCVQVRLCVESLRDRHVLVEILVEIHVVRRQNHGSRTRAHGTILRLKGMPPAGVAANARENLLIVSVNEMQTALEVGLHQSHHVVRLELAARRPSGLLTSVPGFGCQA